MTVYRRLGLIAAQVPDTPRFLELLAVEPWMEDAICAQTDPEAFFPQRGGSSRQAKAVCLACEVRLDCLAYALDRGEQFGIWGGLSEKERRQLETRRRPAYRGGGER